MLATRRVALICFFSYPYGIGPIFFCVSVGLLVCWFVGLLLCWFVITNEKTWICLVLRFYEEIFFLNQIVLESQLNPIFYSICFCIPIFLIPPLRYILITFLTAGLLHRAYPYVYFYCKNGFYVLYDRFIGLITSYNVYL